MENLPSDKEMTMQKLLFTILVGILTSSCGSRQAHSTSSGGGARSSEYCITTSEAAQLSRGNVSDESAWRLANYYGLCLSDAARRRPWIEYLAKRGDADAERELRLITNMAPKQTQ